MEERARQFLYTLKCAVSLPKRMKFLITGITGYIGNHVASELVQQGENVLGISKKNQSEFPYVKCDLLNYKKLLKTLRDFRPDVIIHLAGVTSIKSVEMNKYLAQKINLRGTTNLIKAMKDIGLKSKLIYSSSSHVYGNPKYLPIDENHPVSPTNFYGKIKLKGENIIKSYPHSVIARIFSITGPSQSEEFVCGSIVKQFIEILPKKRGTISIKNPYCTRDFSDVRDVASALVYIANKGKYHEIYNICSGEGHMLLEIIDILRSCSKIKVKIASSSVGDYKQVIIGSNSKIRSLGWKRRYKLEKTLNDLFFSYLKCNRG